MEVGIGPDFQGVILDAADRWVRKNTAKPIVLLVGVRTFEEDGQRINTWGNPSSFLEHVRKRYTGQNLSSQPRRPMTVVHFQTPAGVPLAVYPKVPPNGGFSYDLEAYDYMLNTGLCHVEEWLRDYPLMSTQVTLSSKRRDSNAPEKSKKRKLLPSQ